MFSTVACPPRATSTSSQPRSPTARLLRIPKLVVRTRRDRHLERVLLRRDRLHERSIKWRHRSLDFCDSDGTNWFRNQFPVGVEPGPNRSSKLASAAPETAASTKW